MTGISGKLRALLMAAPSLLPGLALAQTAPQAPESANSGQDLQPGEIVVTAQKRSERLLDVPLSITAATGEQLAKAGVSTPADLEKVVPGFTYQPSSYGTPVFTIRGIGFYDIAVGVAPAVSVYVDQVPLPYLAMTEGASLDLDRVEVLKGPQGTLFGQNSTGGAVNYIAAKPSSSLTYGADVSYGRFNAFDLQGFVGGPLSDKVSARVALRTEQHGDWQKSVSRDDTLGHRNFTTGRAIVDWEATDKLRFEINANGWVDKSDTIAAQYVSYSPVTAAALGGFRENEAAILADKAPGADNRAADWDPNLSLRRDDHFYQLSLRGDLEVTDAITLTSISAYSHLKQHAPNDTDGVDEPNFRLTVDANIDSYYQELRLSGASAGGRIKWMVGGNYGYDTTNDDQIGFNTGSNTGLRAPDGTVLLRFYNFINSNHQKIENKAAFASLDYALTDTLTAQGSIRYNTEHRRSAGCIRDTGTGEIAGLVSFLSNASRGFTPPFVTIPAGGCAILDDQFLPIPVLNQELDEDNVSWRGSLNWKPNADSLIYANLTKGYKAGSFPTIPGGFSFQWRPVPQEAVLAYEVGFKTRIPEARVQLSGAVFYYDYKDKQLAGYLDFFPFGNLPTILTIPKSSVRGAELALDWKPFANLTLNFGGAYIDSRVDRSLIFNNPLAQTIDVKGEQFPNTPKWQLVANAEYKFRLSGDLTGFVGSNARYRSKSSAAFGDVPAFTLPSYALVDLRAGVESKGGKWRAEVWGRNVFNKFYLINVSKVVDTTARTAGMPATYGMSVSYRY